MSKWKNQIISLGVSMGIGLVLGVGLLLAFSAVLKGREMPPVLLQPMASICGLVLFCCFLGAAVAAAGLPLGLGTLMKCIICVLCGCIGGVLGVNTGKKLKF